MSDLIREACRDSGFFLGRSGGICSASGGGLRGKSTLRSRPEQAPLVPTLREAQDLLVESSEYGAQADA
ncbi:hypothetical protein SARC_13096 [Sphaeroforma arctica JP610]|uniref:Uncharacterized protein n=1 Tax=Sphaeroforma arctica JP610 TaxID=667725 RepID=A0A0L0FC51_9EUKA|nr:hypothetical protein SARC_13096 [Sphaeroforma arctica JP610]KNC74352.1 hypothetical protein SARC_13096 [Sphaeroforma arctica JP610]|eukprot:XP_014148254.1 hypothetical protein SARC_13096 [Sphaeroforma arctica JP610]